jgi:hypothetical protein
VEKPFRYGSLISTKNVVVLGSGFSVIIMLFGLGIWFNLLNVYKYSREDIYLAGELDPLQDADQFFIESNYPPVVLWGDSYADALAYELGEKLVNLNIPLIGYIKASCPSLIGVFRNESRRL